MRSVDWSAILPIAGAVAGGLTALSATVALVVHTTPSEATEPAPPQPNSVIQTAPDRSLGIDLPHVIADPGSCRRISAQGDTRTAFRCDTIDGKTLTAVKYADGNAVSDVASKYPNPWPPTGTPLGRFVAEPDSDGSWVLRWTQNALATVVEVPGFKNKAAAEQWFQQNDPHLEPR